MRMFHGMVLSRFAMEIATGCVTALAGAIISYGATEFGTGWDDAGPQPGYFPFCIGLLIVLGQPGRRGAGLHPAPTDGTRSS